MVWKKRRCRGIQKQKKKSSVTFISLIRINLEGPSKHTLFTGTHKLIRCICQLRDGVSWGAEQLQWTHFEQVCISYFQSSIEWEDYGEEGSQSWKVCALNLRLWQQRWLSRMYSAEPRQTRTEIRHGEASRLLISPRMQLTERRRIPRQREICSQRPLCLLTERVNLSLCSGSAIQTLAAAARDGWRWGHMQPE